VTAPRDEDLLSRLVIEARQDLQRRRALLAQDQLERSVAMYTPKDFAGALRRPGLAVIAEMKQRTPIMGVLADDYRPADLAHAYTDGGAAAISVLTHMAGFGGRPEHILAARAATDLPILRKDFVTDPFEIAEARAAGADAVLLIVAALDRTHFAELLSIARSRGLAALVEVHDEAETGLALEAGAELIGINHRDLRTFAVDEAGADAILVGEVVMRAADPAQQIRELTSWSA
jgi:indole-3-glycerol phosphate synthase